MPFKETSSNKFVTAFFCACLLLINGLPGLLKVAVKGQNKINLGEPLRNCRLLSSNHGLWRIIASDNNVNLIISPDEFSLVSINSETLLENWKSQIGGRLEDGALTDDESLYFLTSFAGERQSKIFTLNSISLKTGLTNWRKTFPGLPATKIEPLFDDEFVFLSAGDKLLLALRKTNGETSWSKDLTARPRLAESTTKGQIFILNGEKLWRTSIKTGTTIEEIKIKKQTWESLLIKDDFFLFGNSSGELFKINPHNKPVGIRWKIRAGGSISGLFEYGEYVLVTSLDNFVYLFSIDSGKLRWKKRVSGRVNINPLILGQYAVVVSSSDETALVIDLRDGKTVNQLVIENDDYFSGKSWVVGSRLIFQTNGGIYFFGNAAGEAEEGGAAGCR